MYLADRGETVIHTKHIVFLWSGTMATIFCCLLLCGYYSRGVFISLESQRISWRLDKVRTSAMVMITSSTHSLSVLLSAMETTCTTQIAPGIACWPSSEIIRTRLHVLPIPLTATIHSVYFVIVWLLFKAGIYLKKYGMLMSVSSLDMILHLVAVCWAA